MRSIGFTSCFEFEEIDFSPSDYECNGFENDIIDYANSLFDRMMYFEFNETGCYIVGIGHKDIK